MRLGDILFGQGFDGGITDLEVSPYDGYLYVVSHRQGAIYRIAPIDEANGENSNANLENELDNQ